MASRIVSWSDNEICTSPILSSAASIVSFDSTFSDAYMSPTTSETPEPHGTHLGARHTTLPGFSDGGKAARCGHTTLDESFIRHDAYFFEDGNVTFLVDGTLYCVHRYFFSRDSVYFSTRFSRLDIRDHEALPTVISMGDVERSDFEALLSILYPASFEAHELTYEQWKSVLHLSTRWGFASLRNLALKSITPPTPHDQLVLARTYSVDQWVLPALTALCERVLPLSLDEARQMSMEDVILVATVREEIRGSVLRVDVADIPRHVEVTQAGKLNRPMGNDVYWDGPKSGTTGQESDTTMASGVDPKDGTQMIGVTSPPGDKLADSALASGKIESTQAQETAPTEVMTDYSPSKDLNPVPSPALSLAPVEPTPDSPVSEKSPTPEDATVANEHDPTPEPAASADAEPNTGPKTPNADAEKASETPAPTEAPPAIQEKGLEPDGTATELVPQPNHDTEADGEIPTTPKGVAPSSPLPEESVVAPKVKLTKMQKMKMKKRARMEALA